MCVCFESKGAMVVKRLPVALSPHVQYIPTLKAAHQNLSLPPAKAPTSTPCLSWSRSVNVLLVSIKPFMYSIWGLQWPMSQYTFSAIPKFYSIPKLTSRNYVLSIS
ncbi:hypothetical protein OTU49_001899, partial [Cherax quadricarinatus]